MGTRKGLHSPPSASWYLTNGGYWSNFTRAEVESHFQTFRDQLRSHLDAGSQTDWMVSDIFKWQGSSSTKNGAAFLVRHNSSGSWTGHEWLVMVPQPDPSTYIQRPDIFGSVDSYFEDSVGTSHDPSIMLLYNPDGTSSTFDVNLQSDGTLLDGGNNVVGDYGAPLSNPYSNVSGFLPSHTLLKGQYSDYAEGRQNGKMSRFFVFDHNEPAMMLAYSYGHTPIIGSVHVLGSIVEPEDTTFDGYTSGTMSLEFRKSQNTGELASSTMNAFDASQTPQSFSLDLASVFNLESGKRSDGKRPWRKVSVQSSDYVKGYLSDTLIRKQGANYAQHLVTFDGPNGPFIKWGRTTVFPWFSSEPVWPFGPEISQYRTYTQ